MRGHAAIALVVLALGGCASSEEMPAFTVASPTTTSAFLGTTLDKPMPQPDVTLTDTAGKPFNIAEDTKDIIRNALAGRFPNPPPPAAATE